MSNLKNDRFCGTISKKREKLLEEAFSLLMRMDDDQIIAALKEIGGKNNENI